jgi:uncharacterized protein YxeA
MKKIIITIIALILSLQSVNGYKQYNFKIPENIEFLEYQVMTNKCDMTTY